MTEVGTQQQTGGGGAPQEDMTFADWSEKLEAGTSHWLPAYGFQQPSQLHEALLQHDYDVGGQSYVYLETIVEETSDDLRSESEYSTGGWPDDTDSDAGSVIHLPPLDSATGPGGELVNNGPTTAGGGAAGADWSGSERDLAVPKKRRRQQQTHGRFIFNTDPGVQDDEEEEDLPPISSRSSSLVAFEVLERECQEFRTSATSEPFHQPSPLLAPAYSFDSLETSASGAPLGGLSGVSLARWRLSAATCSQDSLEEETEELEAASSLSSSCSSSSSDERLSSSGEEDGQLARSFSSRSAGNESYRSSLKSHRSFDSLITCQEKSPMLNGEFSQSLNNTAVLALEEEEPATQGLYKTVECLNEAGRQDVKTTSSEQKKKGQRSAENLSEDSGFGEHIPRGTGLRRASSSGVVTIAENEMNCGGARMEIDPKPRRVVVDENETREEWETVANYSNTHWQSAPDLLNNAQSNTGRSAVNVVSATTSGSLILNGVSEVQEEEPQLPECKVLKMNTVSTPNLFSQDLTDGEYELHFGDKPSRAQSFKDGELRKTRSRGSNIQITTSFINLNTDSTCSLTGSKVHFSPFVSEVLFRERRVEQEERPDEAAGRRIEASSGGERRPPARQDSSVRVQPSSVVVMESPREHLEGKKTRLGGFFQRFSLRRLSGRDKKKKEKKLTAVNTNPTPIETPLIEDAVIIPLHGPEDEILNSRRRPVEPPPEPPRKRNIEPASPPLGKSAVSSSPPSSLRPPPAGSSAMPTGPREGLLETDLDSVTDLSVVHDDHGTSGTGGGERPPKTRSMLDLGGHHQSSGGTRTGQHHHSSGSQTGGGHHHSDHQQDNRAKSMEFLLDKTAQFSIKPPENELQKTGGGERVMSEAELRVQRSLQKLNVPDWFKNSQLPPTGGFLLKRHSEGGGGGVGGGGPTTGGWQGLSSKTTSLSSLGSRSPTGALLSPSPTPSSGGPGHTFSRWSTNRLASNPGSTSTSPSGSARSSFNYRQPYLGWRSQERLTHPRTPAERLAAGLLQQKQSTPPPAVPNLSEVHSSIKEVTSAIVHYVTGAHKEERLSPNPTRHDSSSSRSGSPRGSTSRFCWLESSFVGNRPVDVPETPVSLSATPEHSKDLHLDLNSIGGTPHRQINGLASGEGLGGPEGVAGTSSPHSSATMEEVLDSLLGLTSGSTSPAPSGSASILLLPPAEFANGTRRHSEGCDGSSSLLQPPVSARSARRVSFDMAVSEGELVRCRYNKCNRTASISEAKKTFKTCHNCTHIYCSRECRRAHWEKHRKTCLHSRVGALCRKVMSSVKEDEESLEKVSFVARRGFLERGRGAVKIFFSCTENAEAFINEGAKFLNDPSYIKWSDFQTDEMGKEMHEELIKMCQNYNPDTRFILYVCVCVVSEVPTTGPVKWERELVSRCGKLKLSKSLAAKDGVTNNKEPDTLILTSLPGARDAGSRKARQVSFTNIQRHLRQRGISLRRQFPDVYQRLCSYVEGSIERFAPVTIYPRDSASGKNFMCIIMPDAEPEKLDLIPTDTSRVQTIDISVDPDTTV